MTLKILILTFSKNYKPKNIFQLITQRMLFELSLYKFFIAKNKSSLGSEMGSSHKILRNKITN